MTDRPLEPPQHRPWETAPAWDGAPLAATGASAPLPAHAAQQTVRRRPIMMTIAGLLGGLGVALLLVHFARIALGTNAPLVVIAIGGLAGLALAYTLPPRQPKSARRTR